MDETSVKPKRTPRKSIIKPKEAQKNPVGRPTKWDPKYCQEVIDFMAQGYSLEAFCGHISVGKEAVYSWREKYPEFSYAVNEAFNKCRVFWEAAAINGLFTEKGKSINSTVWIFNMKNRFGWRDQQSLEVTGSINQNIQVAHTLQPLSIEELYEQYNQKKLASAPKLLED